MIETLPAATDSDLLQRYTRQQDQHAFAELVNRHQAMVLGVATRRTGDPELARDVAQQVFVLLASKAPKLLRHERLAGWLYQTASFEAAKMRTSEQRRRARQSHLEALTHPEQSCGEHWQALEDALAAMAPGDRAAIVSHFFQDLSYAEMAAAAALPEAAMRKRVSRALDHLSHQLQRRGIQVPAVALVTTAVAMQASVPVQATLAGSALAVAASAPAAGWVSFTALMTMHTALKTTIAVAIFAAVPIAWQANQNAELRADLAALTQAPSLSAPSGLKSSEAANITAPRAESMDVARAQARLRTLHDQRAQAENRFASLQSQAAKLKGEVVVSLGRVDEVALKMADLQLLILELERMERNQTEREKLARRVMELTAEMMPVMAEYRNIGADPKLSARMAATTTAKVAGVSDTVRSEMERRLLTHYEGMKRNGLTLDRRPAQNHQDWDRRYGEASVAAMRDIEPLLPANYRNTAMWQSQMSGHTESNLNFLDAAFGDTAPDAAKPPARSAQ